MHCSQHLCLDNIQQGKGGRRLPAGAIGAAMVLRNSLEGPAYCPQNMHFDSFGTAMPNRVADRPMLQPKMWRQSGFGFCFPHIGSEISVAMICQPTQLILHKSRIPPHRREQMAKLNGIEKMSFAELSQLRGQVDRLMVEKQNTERVALRQKLTDMAKEHGLSLEEVLGKGRKGKGSVAPKYRDPKNPDNTWTGRGRMPRWMVAATKGGKSSKDDYLI
jgi:DNA-binding protein H-NS